VAPQQGIALSLTQSEIWAALAFGISFFARLNQPEGQVAVFFYLPCNVAVVVFFSIYLAT
jgi:hypothetical protein